MNELSVVACLFRMVIWADCFVILKRDFLGKIVGADMLMEVVVVVEAMDVVQAGFFYIFQV